MRLVVFVFVLACGNICPFGGFLFVGVIMPQGLQAWDASGNLVVDIGDYSTRIMTSFVGQLPGNQRQIFYAIGGVTANGCFAVITQGNDTVSAGLLSTEITAVASNGGVWLVGLNLAGYTRTVTIDVYQYN